jgi:multisubunit Na+/H+ antiporter MnhB subunit
MPEHRQVHRTSTRVMSILMIVIGIALLVRTFAAGGGAVATGVILGLLFIAAGAARLYLQFRGS